MIAMEIKGIYNTEDTSTTVLSSSNISPSPQQVKDEVSDCIPHLKARDIKDWQILSIWSEIARQQGNYAAADTVASAAIELGKPIE